MSELFDLPFSTPHATVTNRTATAVRLQPRVGDKTGHPTILSPELEEALFERILYVEARRLGLTPIHVRRATFNRGDQTQIFVEYRKESGKNGLASSVFKKEMYPVPSKASAPFTCQSSRTLQGRSGSLFQ